ncbi:hypothetical protein Tco_1546124, partial [Tanacetum coccineum]
MSIANDLVVDIKEFQEIAPDVKTSRRKGVV